MESGLNLSDKLHILNDFLAGRDNQAISQGHIDKTAFSVTCLVAAFGENPYVIRDYRASESNPLEILAPPKTWGSIKPRRFYAKSDEIFILELHNQKGCIELALTPSEVEIVVGEIAVCRVKSA